jgi:hypothetical protein
MHALCRKPDGSVPPLQVSILARVRSEVPLTAIEAAPRRRNHLSMIDDRSSLAATGHSKRSEPGRLRMCSLRILP